MIHLLPVQQMICKSIKARPEISVSIPADVTAEKKGATLPTLLQGEG